MKYEAFISYRHLDNTEIGRQWATWLHHSLETYEVPDDLVGKENRLGNTIPSRIYPVFRDEEALPADADLTNVITSALDRSSTLIVLCSPRARKSQFVAEEISYFQQIGRGSRIIAAIIDGEPNVSLDLGKRDEGYKEDEECFPLPLQFIVDNEGRITDQRTEPVAADFRVAIDGKKEQGWTSPEALRRHLLSNHIENQQHIVEAYSRQLELMKLKIISGVIGVPLDVLTKRDKEYQLKQQRDKARSLRKWLTGIASLAAVALMSAVVAIDQRDLANTRQRAAEESALEARAQRDNALQSQSKYLLQAARQANAEGDYDLGLLLGLHAVPGPYGGDRPLVDQYGEIRAALLTGNIPVTIKSDSTIDQYFLSRAGDELIYTNDSNSAYVVNTATGGIIDEYVSNGTIAVVAYDDEKRWLAFASGKQLSIIDRVNGRRYEHEVQQGVTSLEFNVESETLFGFDANKTLYRWSLVDQAQIYANSSNFDDLPWEERTNFGSRYQLTISKDSKYLVSKSMNYRDSYHVFNADSGALIWRSEKSVPILHKPMFTIDGKYMLWLNSKDSNVLELSSLRSTVSARYSFSVFNDDTTKILILRSNAPLPDSVQENRGRLDDRSNNPILFDKASGLGHRLTHTARVLYGRFLAGGNVVMTATSSHVLFWDVNSGTLLHSVHIPSAGGIEVARGGDHFAVIDDSKSLKVWSTNPDYEITRFNHPLSGSTYLTDMEFYRAVISENGSRIYVPSDDRKHDMLIIKDKKSVGYGRLYSECTKSNLPMLNAVFPYKSDQILVRCGSHEYKYYDISTGKNISSLSNEIDGKAGELVFSPRAQWSVIIGDETIRISSLSDASMTPIVIMLDERFIGNVSVWFDSRERYLGVSDLTGRVRIIDIKEADIVEDRKFDNAVTRMAISGEKRSYLVDVSEGVFEEFSFIGAREVVNTYRLSPPVHSLNYIDEGESLAFVSGDVPELHFWGRAEEGPELIYRNASKEYTLSNDGLYLISTGYSYAHVVDVDKRSALRLYSSHTNNHPSIVRYNEKTGKFVVITPAAFIEIPEYRSGGIDQAVELMKSRGRCLSNLERKAYYLPVSSVDDSNNQNNCN